MDSVGLSSRRMLGPRRAASSAILVLLLLGGGCKRSEPPEAPPPPTVTVARPLVREVVEWDEYNGYLEAVEFVDVRARVSGLITSTQFEEGAIVKRGDPLIEIDVRPFAAELESRRAEEARAAAQVDLAQIEFGRIDRLPKDSRSPIEYETAAASLREAQAVLAAAKAAVESARLNVEWCHVTAPITGRVSRRYVTTGNLITGGGEQGTLLTTIASIDPIYCYIDADERSVLKYQRLAQERKRVNPRDAYVPCFLQLADETGFPHAGAIDFVDNRLDPTTGTMRARGVFPNLDAWLIPGFFGRVRVPGKGPYQTLLVPDAAVTTDQNRKGLLVVGPDRTVESRAVKLGALFGELRSIESGIDRDDWVIVNGLMLARPGAKVRPQESSIPETATSPESLGLAPTEPTPVEQKTATTTPSPGAATSQPGSRAESRPAAASPATGSAP